MPRIGCFRHVAILISAIVKVKGDFNVVQRFRMFGEGYFNDLAFFQNPRTGERGADIFAQLPKRR